MWNVEAKEALLTILKEQRQLQEILTEGDSPSRFVENLVQRELALLVEQIC